MQLLYRVSGYIGLGWTVLPRWYHGVGPCINRGKLPAYFPRPVILDATSPLPSDTPSSAVTELSNSHIRRVCMCVCDNARRRDAQSRIRYHPSSYTRIIVI
jgi:hypothetical protein